MYNIGDNVMYFDTANKTLIPTTIISINLKITAVSVDAVYITNLIRNCDGACEILEELQAWFKDRGQKEEYIEATEDELFESKEKFIKYVTREMDAFEEKERVAVDEKDGGYNKRNIEPLSGSFYVKGHDTLKMPDGRLRTRPVYGIKKKEDVDTERPSEQRTGDE